MDTISKQEFRIRDLPTRSVTLFPTQAQIVRDIKDVTLQPGINQITVVGLSPTVDENSMKVEGTGSAIISDISVQLLPNREIFEEVYPDEDEDEDTTDSEAESEPDWDDPSSQDSQELKQLQAKLTAVEDQQKREAEVMKSADAQLKILQNLLDQKRTDISISEGIDTYREGRAKAFTYSVEAEERCRQLDKESDALQKQIWRLQRQENKVKRKASRAKDKARRAREKERLKKQRRKNEQAREKKRVHDEREQFWPRKCYSVRITLDVPSYDGSGSLSRRSSVASLEMVAEAEGAAAAAAAKTAKAGDMTPASSSGAAIQCDLSITYVTSSAFWSPTYDLKLSTATNTGTLCFDAKLINMTSEAWTNCKLVMSTSQTSFSGLNDTVPKLEPWRIRLQRGGGWTLYGSLQEQVQQREWRAHQRALVTGQKPRRELFGLDSGHATSRPIVKQKAEVSLNMVKRKPAPAVPLPVFGAAGAAATSFEARQQGGFCSTQEVSSTRQMPALFGGSLFNRSERRYDSNTNNDDNAGDGSEDEDDDEKNFPDVMAVQAKAIPELEFQESSLEETGLTTTYELPGVKTLTPSLAGMKQRVARAAFSGVVFSYTIVAKYRPVAYLRARVPNTSKLTLLKGPAGLTLDGAFMGRVTLPRCSSGSTFPLDLGVDPAIRVSYPKPNVQRSTNGMFTKEDMAIYTRYISIVNTRSGGGGDGNSSNRGAVSLRVLDQVPVSEDERLRVEIRQPLGLVAEGASVPAGVTEKTNSFATSSALDTAAVGVGAWGSSQATLQKNGEVAWEVNLNGGGRAVKLVLEYLVSVPKGEGVGEC